MLKELLKQLFYKETGNANKQISKKKSPAKRQMSVEKQKP